MNMISAKIVADSICNGHRITTMEVVFPRFILAELNTHRLFSRNSASSRAIPFEKMVKEVEENPFIPIAWQKDHKGMQGTEYITDDISIEGCVSEWLEARDEAVAQAKRLHCYSVTKQLCNRLLEPFMWHKVLITATEWDNFFNLRCPQYFTPVSGEGFYAKSWKELQSWHSNPENEKILENADLFFKLKHNKGQAEIHMMALAEAMYDAMNESKPKELEPGQWHIPYGDNINDQEELKKATWHWIKDSFYDTIEEAIEIDPTLLESTKSCISVARCARLSYQTLGSNPKIDYIEDIKLHDSLQDSKHLSPFEHCSKAMTDEEYREFYKGSLEQQSSHNTPERGWCNNFKGWIQYRYLIENK